jgi:hypothetical protein
MNVMKLFDVHKGYDTTGLLGVEIEVEGGNLPRHLRHWNREHDGSLKGGIEFVLKRPMSLLGVRQAILEMKKSIKYNSSHIKDSVRAGVHVHVNMQKESKEQLFNTIVMWAIFEDILLTRCGKYRKGNLFCLPLSKSDNVVRALRKFARVGASASLLNSEDYRYCALNVCSLRRYGSLEFRALRTSPDLEVTYQWAKLLLNMKRVACTYKNPIAILEELEEKGIKAMYRKVFGKSADFLGKQVGLEHKCSEGVLTASCIAYASKWAVRKEVLVDKVVADEAPIMKEIVDLQAFIDAVKGE